MSMRDQYDNLDQYAMYDYKDVSNAYGHGEYDAIDKILKIIDGEIDIVPYKGLVRNGILLKNTGEILAELIAVRKKIESLKGGERE